MKIKFTNITDPIPIDSGWTLTENYNETLDSATIRLSHLSNEIDIEPFDDVQIQYDSGAKYRDMCIDSFSCTQEAIGQSDTTFSYTINLFSLTKKLEGIILPNLSITPHKVGTKISIYNYLKEIRYEYAPRHLVNNAFYLNWAFSQNFIDKFENIECPEMQWSNPTFRELFNDLTMIGDCIVILRKKNLYETSEDTNFPNATHVIDFIDITDTTDANSKPYNFITKSRSSDDYISEIRMDLQNVMQTNVEGVNNTVTTAEYLTLTSDDAIITSENCHLKTQFPILNIKHLWMYIVCSDGTIEDPGGQNIIKTTIIKSDLCEISSLYNNETDKYSLVVEQKEYDSLKAIYRSDIVNVDNISQQDGYTIGNYYSKYKNFYLHFVRNSNIINGFNQLLKPIFATETSTLYYLKKIVACNAVANGDLGPYGYDVAQYINTTDNSYFSTFFQIEYETTYDSVFQASKGDRPRNNRVIADNQTNAWVDAYSQGFLEYQKANRLGNMQKMYNQRLTNVIYLYEIGDKIGDDIVYRTEYQFYPDHFECNAYATKDYVLRDYFTGIKSKIRTWVNAREEAFIRHDLEKFYCEFAYNYDNAYTDHLVFGANVNLPEWLLYHLEGGLSYEPIKYVLIRTTGNGYHPSVDSKFALNCVTRLIGNSIVLTTGFEDNWIVDKHPNTGDRDAGDDYDDVGIIEKSDVKPIQCVSVSEIYPPYLKYSTGSNKIGGVATNYYKYCDDNGEFDYIQMYFLLTLNVSEYIALNNNDDVQDLFIDFYNLPVVKDKDSNNNDLNEYVFGIERYLKKDNKEKPVISTQFEFCVADKSITFTKLFLETSNMIRSKPISAGMLKLYGTTHNYLQDSDISNITLTPINSNTASIEYTGPTSGVKYVEICDSNGNALLSYDITKNNKLLYLNIRRYL